MELFMTFKCRRTVQLGRDVIVTMHTQRALMIRHGSTRLLPVLVQVSAYNHSESEAKFFSERKRTLIRLKQCPVSTWFVPPLWLRVRRCAVCAITDSGGW